MAMLNYQRVSCNPPKNGRVYVSWKDVSFPFGFLKTICLSEVQWIWLAITRKRKMLADPVLQCLASISRVVSFARPGVVINPLPVGSSLDHPHPSARKTLVLPGELIVRHPCAPVGARCAAVHHASRQRKKLRDTTDEGRAYSSQRQWRNSWFQVL